jgi:predicted transcriptional regulator
MSRNEVILIPPKIIQIFPEEEVAEVLSDINHVRVLKLLKKKALTVRELELKMNKDKKTIYRYLLKLKKSNLVVEAGKRYEANSVKGKTLFGRSAHIIYVPSARFDETDKKERISIEILNHMLQDKLKLEDSANINQLGEISRNLKHTKNELIESFFNSHDNPKIMSLISELDIHELIPILDFAGWIFLFNERPELVKELVSSFK